MRVPLTDFHYLSRLWVRQKHTQGNSPTEGAMKTCTHYLDVYLSTSILYREQNLSDNITEICHARSQSIYFTILDTEKIVSRN